jgi:predicted transcriptional regulator
MSGKLMERVVDMLPGLSHATARVLFVLARYADDNGTNCFPSLDTIAGCAEMPRSTVIRGIAQLVALGLVRQTTGGGRASKNHYLLNIPHAAKRVAPRHPLPNVKGGTTPQKKGGVTPQKPAPQLHINGSMVRGNSSVVLPDSIKTQESKTSNLSPAVTRATPQRQFPLPVVVASNVQPAKRHRLPPSWVPSAEDRAYATERKLNPDNLLLDFRAHFDNAPDSKALKSDWSQAWQWWCRNEIKFFGRSRATHAPKLSQAEKLAEMLRRERGHEGETINGWSEPFRPLALAGD